MRVLTWVSEPYEPSALARTLGRHFTAVWFTLWFAAVLTGGYYVARSPLGKDEDVAAGCVIAIVGGSFFAWLSGVGRRVQQERAMIRVELHHVSGVWCILWFGGSLIAGWALVDDYYALSHHEGSIIVLGLSGVVVGGFFARAAGRRRAYLRVDVPAGVVEHVAWGKATACPIDELGRLEIVEHRPPYTGRRYNPIWYRLVAPGLANIVLYESLYPKGVRKLLAMLQPRMDALRDQCVVRRVLAETPTDGTAFRAAPSLAAALEAAVEDPHRLRAALTVLRQDLDVEIQRKASSLLHAPTSQSGAPSV